MSRKLNPTKLTVKDFKEAPYNPRSITQDALKRLGKSIDFHGDLSTVVLNATTGLIVAGHQRLKTIRGRKTKVVTKPAKDNHGTVAVGHIEVSTDKGTINIPLRVVEWDKRTEKLANIAANSHGGAFDNQKLGKLLAELDTGTFDIESTGFTSHEVKNLVRKADKDPGDKYVRTLASPIYTIRGTKPSFKNMYDTTRSDAAREKIRASGADANTKKFLLEAAARLTEFNYANIAEFYAHADKKTQELMEDLALVIVDADRAIELGYLTMTKEIAGLVKGAREKIAVEADAKKKKIKDKHKEKAKKSKSEKEVKSTKKKKVKK